ncbi:FeoB-associated Cys-rich membrane protein [Niallia taxi]|uniref:FeoB-associated Cys-rich membrane protein n=1 Tax=Niallia taxi TaxID=2499688 RepID=UPI00300B86A2
MKLSKKEKKEYKKTARNFLLSVLAFPIFTSKSMAAPLKITPSQNTMGLLIPPDFITTCMTIILTFIILAVVAAIVLLILAGVMRMMKQKKFAIEWTSDIIHGFAQVLVALPIILLLFFLTVLVLKNLPIFSGLLTGI